MENRALVIYEPGRMEVTPCEIPQIQPDEILVRVKYVAVCGSDVKLFDGTYTAPHKYPIVFGHEWLGRVIKAGAESGIPEGVNVVGSCSIFCDTCFYCGFNKNHCEHIEKRGITVDGGAAEYIAVKGKHVTVCPNTDAELEKLLTLTEPVSVAVNGIVNRVPVEVLRRTRSALIIGCGGIGLASLFTLLEYDIPEIVMIDVAEDKVNTINSFCLPNVSALTTDGAGLAKGVDPNADEGAQMKNMENGFDLIVEATGVPASLQSTVLLAAPCAHIVCLGHQKPMEFDFGKVITKSLTLHASNGSTGGFEKAQEIIEKRWTLVEKMITDEVEFEDVPDYFREKIHTPSKIKVIIHV